MKNLKKVLALVLAFACAFTMFAGALTFSDVKPGDDYSAAITMLSDLEVISGNGKGAYEPTKAITRAEACVLIANVMNGGKADTARFAGGSNFSDVAKTYWGESAIAYCVQMGVTYGVGGGKFAPDRTITDAEFIAMVTRAMGYDTPANPLKFPYGNYAAAVDNGIVDNVPYVEGSDCTKGEAAQILYDCLFADYARYTATQNTVHKANDDDHDSQDKLIEVVFGLERAALGKGKFTSDNFDCEAHYWVIVGADCSDEDTIVAYPIDDKDNDIYDEKKVQTFEFEGDATELVGYKVILWGEESHSNDAPVIDEVKAIELVDGVNDDAQKVYEYNPSMDDDDNNGKYKFDGETIEFSEVQNAKGLFGSTDKKAIEKAMNVKDGSSYKIFDWDNDGKADYIVKTVNEYYEVISSSKKTLKLKGLGDKNQKDGGLLDNLSIKLDDDTEVAFDCVRTDKSDVKHDIEVVAPSGLEIDDIVCLTYIRAGLNGEISNACTYDEEGKWELTQVEPETQEITKISAKNKDVYFDGEIIDGAVEQFDGDIKLDTVAKNDEYVDDEYDLYLDANGFIIRMNDPDSSESYLLVTGQKDGKNKTGDRYEACISAVLADGTYLKDADLDEDAKVYIEGVKKDNIYDDETNKIEQNLVGHVFKYSMDGDTITKLTEVALANNEAALKAGKDDYSYDKDKEQFTVTDEKGNAPKFWADQCEYIFAVKVSGNDTLFGYDDADLDDLDLDEIDPDDVRVVTSSDLPKIGDGKDTEPAGVRYDVKVKTTTSFDKAAAIGVSTFKYFKGSDSTIALVTDVHAITGNKFEIDAYIPGKTEKTYTTVKKADLEENVWNDLEDAEELFEALGDEDNGEMLYAELEFDTDGAVVGFNLPDNADLTKTGLKITGLTYDLTEVDKDEDAVIADGDNVYTDITVGGNDYGVARVILNRQTTKGKLFVSKAQYTGVANYDPDKNDEDDYKASPIWSVEGAAIDFADSYDVYVTNDKTKYNVPGLFKQNGVITVAGGFFTDELEVEDEVADSFFNDNNSDGEYYFADVITNDDGKIIMVVVFDVAIETEEFKNALVVEMRDKGTSLKRTYGSTWTETADKDNSYLLVKDLEGKDYTTSDITVEGGLLKVREITGTEQASYADLIIDQDKFATADVGTYTTTVKVGSMKTTVDVVVTKADAFEVDATWTADSADKNQLVIENVPTSVTSAEIAVYDGQGNKIKTTATSGTAGDETNTWTLTWDTDTTSQALKLVINSNNYKEVTVPNITIEAQAAETP